MTTLRIIEKGLFECFESGLRDAEGRAVNAEISAVVWDGRRLVMASDKNVPGAHRSPVFALECAQGRPQPDTRVYYTAELIRTAQKYEDFALTPDGRHLIATTGFDRNRSDSADLHHYNRLLVWPVDAPHAPRLVAESERAGVRSSVDLRRDLGAALGAPYFKIEGLAAIAAPAGGDQRLLFGVREVGQDHNDFDYVCRVLSVPFRMRGDELILTGDVEPAYAFDPSDHAGIRFEVGLSSLEYDPAGNRLYFLTSFEAADTQAGDRMGAYLWQVPLAGFFAGQEPEAALDESGKVFEFANKAEGIAVLDDGRLFVVYDPDRELRLEYDHPRAERAPNEAPYTVIEIR